MLPSRSVSHFVLLLLMLLSFFCPFMTLWIPLLLSSVYPLITTTRILFLLSHFLLFFHFEQNMFSLRFRMNFLGLFVTPHSIYSISSFILHLLTCCRCCFCLFLITGRRAMGAEHPPCSWFRTYCAHHHLWNYGSRGGSQKEDRRKGSWLFLLNVCTFPSSSGTLVDFPLMLVLCTGVVTKLF